MSVTTVPILSKPSQKLNIALAGQQCSINVYQKSTGVFLDLFVDSVPIVIGVICRDRVRLVAQAYLAFDGDLFFYDTQGSNDPAYEGFGERYQLVHVI